MAMTRYSFFPMNYAQPFRIVYLEKISWRSSHQRCSMKKVFLKVLQNWQENTCARVRNVVWKYFLSWKILRSCSYGGELARLGRLAHLGKISLSLRNSYKNIMCCSYEKWASLGGISLDFARIPPRQDEHFPYEQAQVSQPGKVG